VLGYVPAKDIYLGLRDTYSWFVNHYENSCLIKD